LRVSENTVIKRKVREEEEDDRGNSIISSFIISSSHVNRYGDKTKRDETIRICSSHQGSEKCKQHFVSKTSVTDTTWDK